MRMLDDTRLTGETHAVANQPPPLAAYNLLDSDAALLEGLRREGAGWAEARARAFGALAGSARLLALGEQANRNTPALRTHDRFGHRVDEVEYHPAWHEIMRLAMAHELHCLPWRQRQPGAHVARSAMCSMLAQVEAGAGCPITMTFAALPTLRQQPEVASEWEPRILATDYDPRSIPAERKTAALVGMAMTEKQGGSDLRANSTRGFPLQGGGPGQAYELVGHKWFCSAPMCDAFLTLARTGTATATGTSIDTAADDAAPDDARGGDRGVSCFLVPRWRPDGTRNPFLLQRLKDKLGNRSNASSEVEYRGTWAVMVGEEGRGIRTIIDMVHHTRLDCVSGSAGLMRQAVAQALHHAEHRSAFGRRLSDQPAMRNVLADLALESEAATALFLRLARAYDEMPRDAGARAFARIATAVGKYWVCKRAPHMIYEAMECLGGNGYVEESILPRLYREAPVNAIWEGSGNVICLDVLRAIAREPETAPALLDELRLTRGENRRLDAAVLRVERELADPADAELRARRLVEAMALALEASLLVRHAPPAVADAFCASRLDGDAGLAFGTLPRWTDFAAILSRAAPAQ